MSKELATGVSWQNGQALVSCDVKASCSSCASRAGCGSRVLNKLGPQTTHTIVVPCDEPLVPGQKVELGIAEGSLLSSALLVYMSPLVGLFLIASLFQLLFASDIAALCGAILGGAIAPGPRLSFEALSGKTASLPLIGADSVKKMIGTNSPDSMRAGVIGGIACMIDGMIERYEEELGEKATIVATGGYASLIAPLCRRELIVDPDLVLEGLHIIYKKNQKK